MKDWILKKIKENNANNVIAFPLRQEDVERRLRNAILDKDREKSNGQSNGQNTTKTIQTSTLGDDSRERS
tara:strand:- start:19 stop:228 length:210 start_codon:yes stop_codon:yes gene_type:complete